MSKKYVIELEYSVEDDEWAASFAGEPFFSTLSRHPENAVKNLLKIDAEWWTDADDLEDEDE